MRGIDFKVMMKDYYDSIGLDVPDFDERIKAYELHIGLDSVVYCSFVDNWKQAERVTRQMEHITGKL